MMDGPDDDYWPEDMDHMVSCPHCSGSGEINCYCAGDFCICDNQGDAPCPVCGGEGDVTEERYERYMANQRRNAEIVRSLMERASEPAKKAPSQ